MTLKDRLNNEYFEWMFDLACADRFSPQISFRRLLMHLHNTEFIFSNSNDSNRADDGIGLRYRFLSLLGRKNDLDYLDGPCSVLEMMLALAIRCEEHFMDDPDIGDRTSHWFWVMITNLGLGAVTDDEYDRVFVDDVVYRFLYRDYEPDGKGGLFRVKHCRRDMRNVEIWYQMCYYLDDILGL